MHRARLLHPTPHIYKYTKLINIMKIKDLREFINNLPEEFEEFDIVNAEMGEYLGGEFTYRLDKPVTTLAIDEESKELLILNQPPLN
jgi:hypothetical protein